MELQIYRNNATTVSAPIDAGSVYTHEVMGVHDIKVPFISQSPLDIKVDDYIMFRGERYKILNL